MDAKGTAITTIPDFVKKNYPDRYNDWLAKLTPAGKKIMENPILATGWYPLTEGMIQPMQALAETIGVHPEKAAFLLGRYSSEISLNGVYKIFLRVSTPLFVLSRASTVLGSYYRPANIEAVGKTDNSAKLKISGFGGDSYLVLHRIAGWVERTIEITGFKEITVDVEVTDKDTLPCGFVTTTWKK